jgi:hypothetical protein
MQDLRKQYETDKNFKIYCDKAIERGEAQSLDELLKHKMIEHVAEYYQSMKGVDE